MILDDSSDDTRCIHHRFHAQRPECAECIRLCLARGTVLAILDDALRDGYSIEPYGAGLESDEIRPTRYCPSLIAYTRRDVGFRSLTLTHPDDPSKGIYIDFDFEPLDESPLHVSRHTFPIRLKGR